MFQHVYDVRFWKNEVGYWTCIHHYPRYSGISSLKLGNACYYSLQNLLSSSFLSKKLKIKIYRNIILPIVLYGFETWSLTLREERRLRVFKNKMLRRVFGPKRDEVTGE